MQRVHAPSLGAAARPAARALEGLSPESDSLVLEGPQRRVRYARRGALERWANLWANQSGQIGRIWRGRGPTEYIAFIFNK